jgi:hypothetical protein
MSDTQKLSTDLIARMARDLVGTPLHEQELEAVAALVSGLASEMAAMRAIEIVGIEPATTYDPRQP